MIFRLWVTRVSTRPLVATSLLAMALGCGSRSAVDLRQAARFEGDWDLVIDVDPGPAPVVPARIRGAVAFVANRAGTRVADFPGVPVALGVHDLRLEILAPGDGLLGAADVAAGMRGDSAVVVIGPNLSHPIRMQGVWRGDSIAGRWVAARRAGPSFAGSFLLARR